MKRIEGNSQTSTYQSEIRKMLAERNAVLLAHNYEPPEVQDVADFCGDSLELSIKASETESDVIVFCGVRFMAETASVLCPGKRVILPVLEAGCPLADTATATKLREWKEVNRDCVVVSYVNTTAEVKAQSDICCTSANSLQVAGSVVPSSHILMVPDRNLARYTERGTRRKIYYWDGYCPIHNDLTAEQVKKVKDANPDALFLAHPECSPEVLDLADAIKSTSGMMRYVADSNARKFIIGTETGILHPLSKVAPGKMFIPASAEMICPDMKKIGLRDIVKALKELEPEIKVSEEIREKARRAVERMFEVCRR